MRDALYAAGRPVVLSLCEWGDNKPWEWAKDVGHLWRTTGDITNCFDCEVNHGTWSSWGIMKIVKMRKGIRIYAGPDHWNDPDMLEVGNGMTQAEDRAHFSLWCMLAAPLIAGNDLRNMKQETIEILTNKEAVAVDQDSLGVQCFKYTTIDSTEVYAKPLRGGDWAITFLNRGTKTVKIQFDWKKQSIIDDFAKLELRFDQKSYKIRDLWAKKNIGTTDSILKTDLSGHDVLMLRLMK